MNRVAAISILVACAIAAAAVAFMALQSDDVGEGSGSDDDKGDTGTIFARFNSNILKIDLADNSSSKALVDRLKEGDVTVDLEDYGGFEKSGDLGFTLPRNDKQMHTVSGDVILYQGRTFVIYYDENDWSLTSLGKVVDPDPSGLRELLGEGGVTVTLSLK